MLIEFNTKVNVLQSVRHNLSVCIHQNVPNSNGYAKTQTDKVIPSINFQTRYIQFKFKHMILNMAIHSIKHYPVTV